MTPCSLHGSCSLAPHGLHLALPSIACAPQYVDLLSLSMPCGCFVQCVVSGVQAATCNLGNSTLLPGNSSDGLAGTHVVSPIPKRTLYMKGG